LEAARRHRCLLTKDKPGNMLASGCPYGSLLPLAVFLEALLPPSSRTTLSCNGRQLRECALSEATLGRLKQSSMRWMSGQRKRESLSKGTRRPLTVSGALAATYRTTSPPLIFNVLG